MRHKVRAVIGYTFLFIGTACWGLGLCAETPTTANANGTAPIIEWSLVGFVVAILVIGSFFIVLSIKVYPEPFCKVLHEDTEETIEEIVEEHNYSEDFEQIYNQLLLQKVDKIIESIQEPQ